uniref:Uncharacterized protein n=1 Tax=Oryza meridionalis TaxID=40149 RepID=A0A0E0EV73_9ORYZ
MKTNEFITVLPVFLCVILVVLQGMLKHELNRPKYHSTAAPASARAGGRTAASSTRRPGWPCSGQVPRPESGSPPQPFDGLPDLTCRDAVSSK